MNTVAAILRLIFYIIANLTSVPSLWILWYDKLLHRNFRSILMIIVISGYLLSISAYLQIVVVFGADNTTEKSYIQVSRFLFYLGSAEFSYGNFCMTIERCFALYAVSSYEKYSSSKMSNFFTCILSILPPLFINMVIDLIWANQLISFLSFFVFSFASVVVSMYLRCYKLSHMGEVTTSLASRYQNQENCKAMVIYLSVSLSEVFSCIVMIVLFYLMHRRDDDYTFDRNSILDDAMYLISSYRIICVHAVLIYYWYRRRRSITVKTILTSQNTDVHFNTMKRLWD
uniref:Serpentine receptor class gamma n=1 Tax=Haemonchus contortus TaxID=6289 RepID=A0A7I4XZH3_HAECO